MKFRYIIPSLLVLIVLVTLGIILLVPKKENLSNTNVENNQKLAEKMVVTKKAILKPSDGHTGSGTGEINWDKRFFVHTIEADLENLTEGKFYEGWLVQPEPFRFFSTGPLERIDDKYTLYYEGSEDYTSFTQVVITEETSSKGLDGIPETHVLEGNLE